MWIGLSDRLKEGTFEWSDGSPTTFTAWALGEPNNGFGSNEDCVTMNRGRNFDLWNDKGCSRRLRFVCSRKTCGEFENMM